jgi:hypothetical protein
LITIPSLCVLELMEALTTRPSSKMRTRHFDEGREDIQQIWPSHPIGVVFFTKMCKIVEDNQVLQWIL